MVPVAQQTYRLVHNMEVGTQQIDDLIVPMAHDCFLEGHHVGPELPKAGYEDRPALVPCPLKPKQVERCDAHTAQSEDLLHSNLACRLSGREHEALA